MTREQEMKQAIREECIKYSPDSSERIDFGHGVNCALTTPSILRHCDPEIMKQAGWVREEAKPIDVCPYCLDKDCTSDHK